MTIYSLDVLLSWFGTVCCSMCSSVAFWPAYRFLRRQVRWSNIPISWRIFQFVVINTVKGFGVVNEAEVDAFVELSCFSVIQQMLAICSLVPLPFLNPAWTSGCFWLTYCWNLAWRILSNYFASVSGECSCAVVWAFFGIAFPWDWNKNWPFPVLWPLLSFPNLLACWVQHFNSIIF